MGWVSAGLRGNGLLLTSSLTQGASTRVHVCAHMVMHASHTCVHIWSCVIQVSVCIACTCVQGGRYLLSWGTQGVAGRAWVEMSGSRGTRFPPLPAPRRTQGQVSGVGLRVSGRDSSQPQLAGLGGGCPVWGKQTSPSWLRVTQKPQPLLTPEAAGSGPNGCGVGGQQGTPCP